VYSSNYGARSEMMGGVRCGVWGVEWLAVYTLGCVGAQASRS